MVAGVLLRCKSSRAAGPLSAVGEDEKSLSLQMCLEHCKLVKGEGRKGEGCSRRGGKRTVPLMGGGVSHLNT